MANVFLSYARDDAATAQSIAAALEQAGHDVWWDIHIRGGAQFSKAIEEALAAADAVVVLWSKRSIESPWVRDEAAAGRDAGRLVPATIDGTSPPLGFRQFHSINLSSSRSGSSIQALLAAVDAVAGEAKEDKSGLPNAGPRRLPRLSTWSLVIAGLALIGVAALLFWRDRADDRVPIAAVTVPEGDGGSAALARDLFVRLGRLQATNPEALSLVASPSRGAAFLLQVGAPTPSRPNASLALIDGKDRTLLWSRTYEQPSDAQADLRQQLAYAASTVLRCAGQASNSKLSDNSRKTFLNACAEYAEGTADLSIVAAMFEQVAQAEPHFRPAWSKLLLAQSSAAVSALLTNGSDAEIRPSLLGHIAEARKRHGVFAELLVVEMELLPLTAFANRLKLADEAIALDPKNPNALFARGDELMSVGRVSNAIADVSRAYVLDPLSPVRRDQNINFLISAGRTAAAAKALADAERLSPGSASLANLRLRFHAWLGDPGPAAKLFAASGSVSPVTETWIAARTNPSPPNKERAAAEARTMFERSGDLTFFAQVMAGLGRADEVYVAIAKLTKPLPKDNTYVYFTPWMRSFRADPRFMQVARGLGLTEYWSKSGKWPDFCFEADLPYDCKAEAAKLGAPPG